MVGLLSAATSLPARTLRVGPDRELTTPSQAADIAREGDEIVIDAGVYAGDAAVWRADELRIRAGDGPVTLRADGAHAQGKAIWVIDGDRVTVEGITFTGASVPDGNGAGIRHQGGALRVLRCRFEHNETGLLTYNDHRASLIVEESVFAHNGPGPRHNHNLYVGRIGEFTLLGSSLHHARVGHNVKSRARVTRLLYNRIVDGTDGYSSYAVDLPEGGDALLLGNVIQQGPRTENRTLISFGAEGRRHAGDRLRLVHNTLVNDAAYAIFVRVHGGPAEVVLANNLLVGRGTPYVGPRAVTIGDLHVADGPFDDTASFDYRPGPGHPALDAARAMPPGVPTPLREYSDSAASVPRPRDGSPDVGALERHRR